MRISQPVLPWILIHTPVLHMTAILILLFTTIALLIITFTYMALPFKLFLNRKCSKLRITTHLMRLSIYSIWLVCIVIVLAELLIITNIYVFSNFPWLIFEVILIVLMMALVFSSSVILTNKTITKKSKQQFMKRMMRALIKQMVVIVISTILFIIILTLGGNEMLTNEPILSHDDFIDIEKTWQEVFSTAIYKVNNE